MIQSTFEDDTAFKDDVGMPNAFGIDEEYQKAATMFEFGDDPSLTNAVKPDDAEEKDSIESADDSDTEPRQGSEPQKAGKGIDEVLLGQARRLGFTEEQLKTFGSPDALQNAVDIVLSRVAALGESDPVRHPQQAQQRKQEPEEPEDGVPPFKLQIDDSEDVDYPESIKKAFAAVAEYADRKTARLEKQLKAAQDHLREQSKREYVKSFDGAMAKKAKDGYETHIGTGSTRKLALESPEQYKLRAEVARMMGVIERGYMKSGLGDETPDFDQIFDDAFHMVLKDKVREVERAKANKKKRTKGKLIQGTDRKGSEKRSSDEEAAAFVDSFFSEKTGEPMPLNMGFA